MLTETAIRDAAKSEQPWEQLDLLVRAEMATGRKVREIAEDYWRHAQGIRDSKELSDDGEDALMDTMDALRGTTHSWACYTDPPAVAVLPPGVEAAR